MRAATPTDAAKRIVPDLGEETTALADLRRRARRALVGWVEREETALAHLRRRPALADPLGPLAARGEAVRADRDRGRRTVTAALAERAADVRHLRASLTALGPAATLARGYAIVQRGGEVDSPVLRAAGEARDGDVLRVRVADGALRARVVDGATSGTEDRS